MSANFTLPFQLDSNHFRGRLVRLEDVMNDILSRHDYPLPVARLLGETMLLCALLAGALKYEGIFTLQAKGDGAITDVVADVTSDGAIRGYASYDAKRVEIEDPGTDATALLLGKGYIAFTVDQGGNTERYQGIVELSGRTISDCVAHYFRQSEQIPTGFMVACRKDEPQGWHGGAIMLQRMPMEEDDIAGGSGRGDNDNGSSFEERDDDLRRKMILLGSTTHDELLSKDLKGEDLLYRLFHEENLAVSPSYDLRDECRCSRARVERVLRSLPAEEIAELKEKDGKINVKCEFCNRSYDFDDSDIGNLDKVYHLDIAQEKLEKTDHEETNHKEAQNETLH